MCIYNYIHTWLCTLQQNNHVRIFSLQIVAVCCSDCCSVLQLIDSCNLFAIKKIGGASCFGRVATVWVLKTLYGVATISRLLEITGLFCKRAL